MREYKDVLELDIPAGPEGRPLTSSECRKLHRHGVFCTETYLVVRVSEHIASRGLLFRPVRKEAMFVRLPIMVCKATIESETAGRRGKLSAAVTRSES